MKSSANSKLIGRLVFFSVAMLIAGIADADIRVLIKFDATEHRVQQQVHVKSAIPAFAVEQTSQNSTAINPERVSVRWLGADGTTLLTASMQDPRLVHAPLAIAEASPTMVGLDEGAYMVSGPSNSSILQIRLPANSALALDAQTWQFELNP